MKRLYVTFFMGLIVAGTVIQSVSAQGNISNQETRAAGATSAQSAGYPVSETRVGPAVAAPATAKRIGFRSAKWKTLHSHDANEAAESLEMLRKIGCEAQSQNHGNHIDVQYRCPQWKTMEVSSNELVEQWSTWLISKGLETVVVDPVPGTHRPTVQYRMPEIRTLHLHDGNESTQIINTMKMIDVKVTMNRHGDHTDASFHCPQWKTIQLPDEGHAHAWQDWLKNAGFETKHEHSHGHAHSH